MRGTPAAASRLTSSARTSGSRVVASFCSPSRGPTSQTTFFFRAPGAAPPSCPRIGTQSPSVLASAPPSVASLHAPCFLEPVDLGGGDPEQPAVDVAVVAPLVPG